MALHAGDFADLVVGTLNDLERLKFSQIAQDLQDYEVMGKWLKKDRVIKDGGRGIQRSLMLHLEDVANHVGLLDEDDISIGDHLADITVPWVHARTGWAFEFRSDVLMNKGKSLVQDSIQPRRINAMIKMADLLEAAGWACPSSTTDADVPYGLPYWVVYNATTGFTGDSALDSTDTTYSTAGISTVTYPNWMNYSANYSDASYADLINKMRLAHLEMNYKSPTSVPQLRGPLGQRYRIYCSYTTQLAIEDVARSQNDNLGPDVAEMDGTTVFKGIPIKGIAHIEENGISAPVRGSATSLTNPVYMVDHKSFYPVVLKGDYLRETVKPAPHQVNVTQTFVWLTYNFICIDRRRNAVFSQ